MNMDFEGVNLRGCGRGTSTAMLMQKAARAVQTAMIRANTHLQCPDQRDQRWVSRGVVCSVVGGSAPHCHVDHAVLRGPGTLLGLIDRVLVNLIVE